MTNTKFRKRALLSSVAMMLVALVAMGSATFAWYQASVSVSATGMQMTTTAASGLLIASDTSIGSNALDAEGVWGTSASLTASGTIQPSSLFVDGTTKAPSHFTTTGTGNETSAAPHSATASSLPSGAYVSEKVYFKLDTGRTTSANVQLTSLGMTINSTEAYNIATGTRVYILDMTGKVVGEYAPSAVDDEFALVAGSGNVWTETPGEPSTWALTAGVAIDNKDIPAYTQAATDKPVVATGVPQDATQTYYCEIRIYLDGADGNVTSNKAKAVQANAQQLLSTLSVNFGIVPGTETFA